MKLDNDTLNQWVAQYEEKKTLPSQKIPCSRDGCEVETVVFGTNLHKRVEKAGGIREFLTTFVCRPCRKASKTHNIDGVKVKVNRTNSKRTVAVDESINTNQTETMSTEELMSVFDE